ncbi:MAG: mannose-1-phosphate guanylyltransferase [Anaerolineae bacterium]|nr:mannose-1-phosphate guanylyltransferase [Anaerolineae bacterium]
MKEPVAMEHFYVLIMAGGGGTRLWPLSRRDRPKQVLPLTEERTMFQVTVERLDGLLPPARIFVVTGRDLADPLRESTPQIPAENFIIEPEGRDSGPAAGLGLFTIARRDPQAIIAVLSADHHIANEKRFLKALCSAHDVAQEGYIVTLGIHPSFAATGFGYIQRGEKIGVYGDFTAYESKRFTEKPDEATATTFVSSGMYSWNAGIFIWQAQQAIAEFERQQPEMAHILKQATADPARLATLWKQIRKVSLDYAIMEGAQKVAVIPVDIGWSDVGTWATLFEVLARDENGNAQRGNTDGHIQIDTHQTLIVSDRMVVTIGVDDLVIVDTDDVVLVCHRDRAQDVRDVVQRLKERGEISRL